MGPDYNGPMWIDPRYWERMMRGHRWGWEYTKTTTTTTTPAALPLTEEQVRKIVREEMSDLVKPDIPDAPPEDWSA